jgi:hypothetical protein
MHICSCWVVLWQSRTHWRLSKGQCPSIGVTFPVVTVFNSEKFFPTEPQAGEPPLVGHSAISCSRYPHAVGMVGLFSKQNNKICNISWKLWFFWNPALQSKFSEIQSWETERHKQMCVRACVCLRAGDILAKFAYQGTEYFSKKFATKSQSVKCY